MESKGEGGTSRVLSSKIFCAQTTPSLCFGLFSARGELNPAKRSGLDFWKYTPLCLGILTGVRANHQLAYSAFTSAIAPQSLRLNLLRAY